MKNVLPIFVPSFWLQKKWKIAGSLLGEISADLTCFQTLQGPVGKALDYYQRILGDSIPTPEFKTFGLNRGGEVATKSPKCLCFLCSSIHVIYVHIIHLYYRYCMYYCITLVGVHISVFCYFTSCPWCLHQHCKCVPIDQLGHPCSYQQRELRSSSARLQSHVLCLPSQSGNLLQKNAQEKGCKMIGLSQLKFQPGCFQSECQ